LIGPQLMQSPIGYIAPSVVLKTPQMGILLVVFPQKAQMKITSGFFLVCIFCGLFFVPPRKAGRGRVKEDKPLPLAVGEGPHFESARGLLGGDLRIEGLDSRLYESVLL
jgi:hypothetical protein